MDRRTHTNFSLPVASTTSVDANANANANAVVDGTPRTGTPDSRSDQDVIAPIPIPTPPNQNPFATPTSPYGSQAASRSTSSAALNHTATQQPRYFHSRRIKKGEVERPWTNVKDPREKWVTIIPLIGLAIGLAFAGFLVWDGLRTVVTHKYCPVFEDDFTAGFNDRVWTKEVQLGGFGNGQFEETTATDENVFVRDGMLYIRPTLQDASLIETDGAVIDLRAHGACTSTVWSDCFASTNTTNGTIVNPVKSGRINTKKGAWIKYGRVEVEAELPAGDWLWPAIWLLPVNSTYGAWPQSGEIDIAESRGNNYTYAQGGNDIVSSALHWGPDAANDAWWRTNVKRRALHTTFARTFHTFGLEWSERYLFTYLDTRLLQVLYANFNRPLWARGNFPLADANGTRLVDPWSQTGRDATPFDQDFYLVLNVAVGGNNGWFADGKSGKPWVDGSPTAKRDFWNARDQWFPTWQREEQAGSPSTSAGANSGERGQMVVKSVKMWQQQGYNGCE